MTTEAEELSLFHENDLQPEVVPLFGQRSAPEPVRFLGTAFCWGERPWFLTTAHSTLPRSGAGALPYMAIARLPKPDEGVRRVIHRVEDCFPLRGGDAALLKIPSAEQRSGALEVHTTADGITHALDVWCLGFPLVDEALDLDSKQMTWSLSTRFLKGYITRVFRNADDQGRATIETNVAFPPGASGSPLVQSGSRRVVGIVRGTRTVTIDCTQYTFGYALPLWRIWDEVREKIDAGLSP